MMEFEVTSEAFKGKMTVPNGSFSLVFHDTGALIQMWGSDGLIDEFPALTIQPFDAQHNSIGEDK